MSVGGAAVIVQLPPSVHVELFTVIEPGSTAAAPSAFDAAPVGRTTAPCSAVVAAGNCVALAVPVTPVNGTEVAAIVPVPLAANDAPVPTVIAAVVFVPLVSDEKADDPTVIVQLPPSAQLCPFTVVALLASAVFGIALAATASVGVVAAFVTVGVSHAGHVPAAKLVTVPEPPLPPAGTTQFPSSRRYLVAPAVAPGSGTAPAA
jgi:hypothetical protein